MGCIFFSLKGQSGHRVTSGSCRRCKHIRVWHVHHLEKGWRCSSPSLRWLARPQYGLLLFSRWLTVKTRNYVKVNTTGIMKELQSRCGDVIGRLFKNTHTYTHTHRHTALWMKSCGRVCFPSGCYFHPFVPRLQASYCGRQTDGQMENLLGIIRMARQMLKLTQVLMVVCFELLGTGGAGESTWVGWLGVVIPSPVLPTPQ